MNIGALPSSTLLAQARNQGLNFRAGRFSVRLYADSDDLIETVKQLYSQSENLSGAFADFTVRVTSSRGLRRWFRPQVRFSMNGALPFMPLPREHAYPLLEWGLNWCVSSHCHQYLIIHAAVLEKYGRALILPGPPGSGKSTLCAMLCARAGWRVLSDELTLLDPTSGLIYPNPRPISLKNASIDLVRRELPDCAMSPRVHDTLKGTVSHLRPPDSSMARVDEPAQAGLIVFPQYNPDSESQFLDLPKGEALIRMAENAFNYSILGVTAFRALASLVDRSRCFEYPNAGQVDYALGILDELIEE